MCQVLFYALCDFWAAFLGKTVSRSSDKFFLALFKLPFVIIHKLFFSQSKGQKRVGGSDENAQPTDPDSLLIKMNPSDSKWSKLNKDLLEATKTREWFGMALIYTKMAAQLKKEGKNYQHLLQQAEKCKVKNSLTDLDKYKKMGFQRVRVLGARNEASCPDCQALDNKVFPIQEAIDRLILPVKACSAHVLDAEVGWCRCNWVPEAEDPA